jgi:hypothetical protein
MPASTAGEPEQFYLVKPGDTLGQIAAQFDSTVSALVRNNPVITDPNYIIAGQRLAIPSLRGSNRFTVTISPRSGPPGTRLQVTAGGLPPTTTFQVGAGVVDAEFTVVDQSSTDKQGRLKTVLTIPQSAQPEENWVVVVREVRRGGLRANSALFKVTAPQNTPVTTTAHIYLVALGDTGQSGREIGCGDSLIPVEQQIEPGSDPLEATIRELLAIDSRLYGERDLYNALHRSDLEIEDTVIQDGQAIIKLTGTVRLGGVCDNPRFLAQLEETAKQFPSIEQATILINGQPLSAILSQK